MGAGGSGRIERHTGAQFRIIAEFWPSALIERPRDRREALERYHETGYEMRTLVGAGVQDLSDAAIIEMCTSAGQWGQVNLLLARSRP